AAAGGAGAAAGCGRAGHVLGRHGGGTAAGENAARTPGGGRHGGAGAGQVCLRPRADDRRRPGAAGLRPAVGPLGPSADVRRLPARRPGGRATDLLRPGRVLAVAGAAAAVRLLHAGDARRLRRLVPRAVPGPAAGGGGGLLLQRRPAGGGVGAGLLRLAEGRHGPAPGRDAAERAVPARHRAGLVPARDEGSTSAGVTMRVLITGASGYVGSRLTSGL